MKESDAVIKSRFGRFSRTQVKRVSNTNVVIYTRVSTKEQADNNLSLDTQRKAIEEYARRQNLNVVATFGGTYESAKSDGRKEFQRMLDLIKRSRGNISQILVYTLDRFSRTGGAAIKIASDLREKYGVTVFAVTQPTDTSNPSGVLHQNIQLLFSEFDNQQRRQRVIAGMSEKFRQGIWVVKPPQGYDIIKINNVRKIVVNEAGKKIKKAFEWKAQGMKNEEIVEGLRKLGVKMYKQQVCKILMNPFYAGLVAHGMLNGEVIQGQHEAMISRELFLKVNDIISRGSRAGVPHKSQDDNIPLKVFVKCADCGEPFTGYLMKARGLYYYKCRKAGCKCNRSAKQLHEEFRKLIMSYTLNPALCKPFVYHFEHAMGELLANQVEAERTAKTRLTEATKKLDLIEEKYHVLGEIGKDTFDKFYSKYKLEQEEAALELARVPKSISNNGNAIQTAMEIALKLPEIWEKGGFRVKDQLQRLLFPEGIEYDRKTGSFRTKKVNEIFALIAELSGGSGTNEKGTSPFLCGKSLSAEREGFEPPEV